MVVTTGLISINHPIVAKWLIGSARLIGRPINASVYTNGKLNSEIKIFHADKYWNGQKADYFLLYTPYAENNPLKVISLNRKDSYVGRPSSTNIRDYDFFSGLLFQSEVGAKFANFKDDMKGFNYDPQLSFIGKQIKLNIPPAITSQIGFDSIRIDW